MVLVFWLWGAKQPSVTIARRQMRGIVGGLVCIVYFCGLVHVLDLSENDLPPPTKNSRCGSIRKLC